MYESRVVLASSRGLIERARQHHPSPDPKATPLEAASRAQLREAPPSSVTMHRPYRRDETTGGMEACCSAAAALPILLLLTPNRVGLAYIGASERERLARPGMRGNIVIYHNLSFCSSNAPEYPSPRFSKSRLAEKARRAGAEPTSRATRVLGSSSHHGDHPRPLLPSCVSDSPGRENGLTPARLQIGLLYENSQGATALPW